LIDLERHGNVTVMRLNAPPVNALDREVLLAITATLHDIEASDARAVVLTGAGAAFSAGADLFRVLNEGDEYLRTSLSALTEAFGTLFRFPRPVVAAINGHAIAGGAVLACASDHRIAAAGDHKIGFAELRVGVPFPAWALEIARWGTRPANFQEVIYFGRSYDPDGALARGLIDEIVEPAELMERALSTAERLAAIPAVSFRLMKEAMRRPVVERVEASATSDQAAREAWGSGEVRDAIRGFLKKTFGTDTR
jgi:enoyl-CoA hydratase